MEILDKQPVCISEVKKELSAIKKRDGELNFRAQRCEEYVNEFAVLSQKDAAELVKKLTELDIPRLKDIHIKKMVDVLPVDEKHLKVILSGYTLTVSSDNLKKIMGVVKDYQKA